jgi:hypothetical protein
MYWDNQAAIMQCSKLVDIKVCLSTRPHRCQLFAVHLVSPLRSIPGLRDHHRVHLRIELQVWSHFGVCIILQNPFNISCLGLGARCHGLTNASVIAKSFMKKTFPELVSNKRGWIPMVLLSFSCCFHSAQKEGTSDACAFLISHRMRGMCASDSRRRGKLSTRSSRNIWCEPL